MTLRTLPLPALLVLLGSAGCQSHDHADRFVLGGATDANIALQSVRDPSLPNSRALVGVANGERAAAAVDRLNRGEVIQPEAQSTNGGG